MSIIIITFPGAPKTTPEAIAAEEELEKNLRKTIKGNLLNFYFQLKY